jgi:hypothetical protein
MLSWKKRRLKIETGASLLPFAYGFFFFEKIFCTPNSYKARTTSMKNSTIFITSLIKFKALN